MDDVLTLESKYGHPKSTDKQKRQAWYILSGSFVKYLIENYGKENILNLYITNDFIANIGKSFDELRNDWLEAMTQ